MCKSKETGEYKHNLADFLYLGGICNEFKQI